MHRVCVRPHQYLRSECGKSNHHIPPLGVNSGFFGVGVALVLEGPEYDCELVVVLELAGVVADMDM